MANRFVVSKNQSGGGEYPDLLADLFTAYYCARKNKRNTASQIRFERNLSDNLMRLYDDIVSGHYRVGRSMCFVIRDPVLREVFAASFRDRIVHHLLYNLLMPIFEPTFIYDKRGLRCKHYGRYVDDFYIVGNSSQELLALIPLIKEFLSSHLGLKLHPRKVHLVSVSKGVHFLGAVVKPYQRYIYPKWLSRLKNNLLCSYVEEADPYRILAKQKSFAGYLSHFMNNHQIG